MQQRNPHRKQFGAPKNIHPAWVPTWAPARAVASRWLIVVALLGGAGWIGPSPAPAAEPASTQPANPSDSLEVLELKEAEEQILTVFQSKCVDCHGPQLSKPKKGFGYCLDLKRMAGNRKLVIPLNPGKSKLYSTIADDDMPPEDAKTGPLSKEEKQVVLAALKRWIAAGAPAPAAAAQSPITAASGRRTEEATTGANLSFGKRLLRLIGKFHPLLAHFPIALLVGAAVAELAWLRTQQSWLTGAVRFCTLFGAVGAFVTATLGWADGYWHTADPLLTLHRWLGTAAAAWAIPVVLLSEHGFRRRRNLPADAAGEPRPWFQVMLFAGVALVGIAAHFGGGLVYGTDYLNW